MFYQKYYYYTINDIIGTFGWNLFRRHFRFSS